MRLAIVVPALNEAEALRRHLPAALAAADDVVVSDGGSTDGTRDVARALGARVVEGPPGRGGQLRRGAEAAMAAGPGGGLAGGDVLLFLHADTVLPPGGADAVRAAAARGAPAGAFLLRFDAHGFLYRLGERVVSRRTRWLRVPLGDQAQWATRATYERLGGFADWPLLEDFDFMQRMRRLPGFTIVPLPVTTGARRFVEQGPVRTVAVNWLIWALFFCGVGPERLVRLYRNIR